MKSIITVVAAMLLITEIAAAQSAGYSAGHQALQIWNEEAMTNMPDWVRVWLMIMGLSFALGLLFVRRHPIARWVIGGFIAALLISGWLAPMLGITILSGFVALIHVICWSPALYLLLTKKPFLAQRSAFSLWSGLITAVILFSFIFDIKDAVIYLNHMLS